MILGCVFQQVQILLYSILLIGPPEIHLNTTHSKEIKRREGRVRGVGAVKGRFVTLTPFTPHEEILWNSFRLICALSILSLGLSSTMLCGPPELYHNHTLTGGYSDAPWLTNFCISSSSLVHISQFASTIEYLHPNSEAESKYSLCIPGVPVS